MRIKTGFELRDVCGEKIVMAYGMENIDFSRIICLNDTAAYLWEAMSLRPIAWPECCVLSMRSITNVHLLILRPS